MMIVTPFLLLPLLLVSSCHAEIMNEGGIPYKISNPNGPGGYSADFDEGHMEHFDVYGQVQTLYSQVYWTRNTPINLPPEIVERFKDKVLAITGYEVDQVTHSLPDNDQRKTTTAPVGNNLAGFACYPSCDETDRSVPIYNAYNHHYFSWLVGANAEVYDAAVEDDVVPNPTLTRIRMKRHNCHDNTTTTTIAKGADYPHSIVFKENPGGEYRKSYHGYPSGFAQLVYEPTTWVVEPMQIDTHHRDYDLTDDTVGHQQWFLPQQVSNNMTQHTGGLNPLIECPCTDRITKSSREISPIITQGTCSETISSLQECQAAAESTGAAIVGSGETIDDSSRPTGCIVVPASCHGSKYKVLFNTATTRKDDDDDTVVCGGGKTSSSSLQGHSDLGGLMNMTIAYDKDMINATITLSGPNGVWYGVGFNAKDMSSEPYSLIVDGTGAVEERNLGNHGPGTVLSPSIHILSNTVSDDIRTVVLTRPIKGVSRLYYNFPRSAGEIPLIAAVGNSATLAYHAQRTGGVSITLLPTSREACLCAPKKATFLTYMSTNTEEYHVQCADEPRSNMLRHGDGTGRVVANAACNVETYHGGTHCCRHGYFLTDRNQDSMIPKDKVDTYYLKWRYYFQEYTPSTTKESNTPSTGETTTTTTTTTTKTPSHQHLHHWVFLIDEHVNDYEEDNAHYGTTSIGRITARLTGKEIGLEDIPDTYTKIIPMVMTPHCHAPNCIREELWNLDTNEVICNVTAEYGSSEYGSTNAVFNEANYIALPPCLFGNHQNGLEQPPVFYKDTNLLAVKYFNNTYRHLGQMAQWTGLMVYDTDPIFAEITTAKERMEKEEEESK